MENIAPLDTVALGFSQRATVKSAAENDGFGGIERGCCFRRRWRFDFCGQKEEGTPARNAKVKTEPGWGFLGRGG